MGRAIRPAETTDDPGTTFTPPVEESTPVVATPGVVDEEDDDPTELVPVKNAAPTGITHFLFDPPGGPSLKPTDFPFGVNLLITRGLFFLLDPLSLFLLLFSCFDSALGALRGHS